MTTSSSSPSLLNDGAKNFSHSTHGKAHSCDLGVAENTHPCLLKVILFQPFTLNPSQIQWTPRQLHCSAISVLLAFPKGERWADSTIMFFLMFITLILYELALEPNLILTSLFVWEELLIPSNFSTSSSGSKPDSKWVYPKGSSSNGRHDAVCCPGLPLSSLCSSWPRELHSCCSGSRWGFDFIL